MLRPECIRASGFEWVVYTYIYMPAVLLEQNETRLLDKSGGRLEGFGVEAYLCDPADSAHCFVPGYGWMSDVYLHQQKAQHSMAPISSTLSLSHKLIHSLQHGQQCADLSRLATDLSIERKRTCCRCVKLQQFSGWLQLYFMLSRILQLKFEVKVPICVHFGTLHFTSINQNINSDEFIYSHNHIPMSINKSKIHLFVEPH